MQIAVSQHGYDQIEAKLQSQKFYDKVEAIERIAQLIMVNQDPTFINSIILKIADFYRNVDTTNKLRSHLVKELIAKCHTVLEQHVYNKEEFTNRVAYLLQSNDPQARIISLRLFSYLPGFIQTRLDIQHRILLLLTTTQNQQERAIANQTITMISKGSEIFAMSILNKIEEIILSQAFATETCIHLIMAIVNIGATSINASKCLETIERLYDKVAETIYRESLDQALILSLISVTYKAPVILLDTYDFLEKIECYEGIESISRKFAMPKTMINSIISNLDNCVFDVKSKGYLLRTLINTIKNDPSITEVLKSLLQNQDILQLITSQIINKIESNEKSQLYQTTQLLSLDTRLLNSLTQYQLQVVYLYLCQTNHNPSVKLQLFQNLDISNLTLSHTHIKLAYYYFQDQIQLHQPIASQKLNAFITQLLINSDTLDSTLYTTTLRNFFTTFHDHLDFDTITNQLLLQEQYYLLYTLVLPYLCTNSLHKHQQQIKLILDKVKPMIYHSSRNYSPFVQSHYRLISLLVDFHIHINSSSSIDHMMFKAQDLVRLSVQVGSLMEFVGKDMLEAKDIIQNDNTNDPYKYTFVYLYCKYLKTVTQLEYIKSFTTNEQNDNENDVQQGIGQMQTKLRQTITYIKRLYPSITLSETLQPTLPHSLFTLTPPLFIIMHLMLDESTKVVNQDEVQVRKDVDFIANVRLRKSLTQQLSTRVKSQQRLKQRQCVGQRLKQRQSLGIMDHVILDITLIQNHSQQFHPQSSEIVSQETRVIQFNNFNEHTHSDKQEVYQIVQLKFPTIGTYVLRLESKILVDSQVRGVETFKNLKFRVT